MKKNIHIALEGMDGVGKTTTAIELNKKLSDFRFIEKPLHYIVDDNVSFDNYIKIRDYFNKQERDDVLRAWFYGLGNILTNRFNYTSNIITDRHLVSNYFWCGTENSKAIFDLLIHYIGIPDLTIVLTVKKEEAIRRLKNRNKEDNDIHKVNLHNEFIKKSEYFLNNYNMPYLIIDSTNLTVEEVVSRIKNEMNKLGLI